jgi:beta-galactosidase beta subunit
MILDNMRYIHCYMGLDSLVDEVFYRVEKGDLYIVWPGEAHRPFGKVPDGSAEVRKIVCKIKLNGKIQ